MTRASGPTGRERGFRVSGGSFRVNPDASKSSGIARSPREPPAARPVVAFLRLRECSTSSGPSTRTVEHPIGTSGGSDITMCVMSPVRT